MKKMIGQLLKIAPKKKRKKIMIGYMIPKKAKASVASDSRLDKNKVAF